MTRVALALVLCACGPDTDLSVYSEPSLEVSAGVAIEAWNEALSRGPCYGVNLYPLPDSHADVTVWWGDAHGWTAETISRRIVLRRDATPFTTHPGYVATTIAHELGHALGAEDAFDDRSRDDLMWHSPPRERGPEPTGWDVAQVCLYFERETPL